MTGLSYLQKIATKKLAYFWILFENEHRNHLKHCPRGYRFVWELGIHVL